MINKKELTFTFHSDGTYHPFAPFKNIIHPFDKKKVYQLEVYRDLVSFRNSPTCFIVDNSGHVLKS